MLKSIFHWPIVAMMMLFMAVTNTAQALAQEKALIQEQAPAPAPAQEQALAQEPAPALAAPKVSKVIKSDHDAREYRYLTLANSLNVLLISDAKTEKAAAALNVQVGSNQNPKQFPGLAHFLEHMLFLGTEKYPAAGEYQAFISQHGGSDNAYTAAENTNYFFDIEPAFLEPALDRFAQFFIAPSLNENYIAHEKNAVNAEYLANINDDNQRAWDVYRSFFNPEHPAANFSVGSLETLADSENQSVGDALRRFHQTHYSAQAMALVVIGHQSLDSLQQMVETRFTQIPNLTNLTNLTNIANSTNARVFLDGALPLSIYIKPVKELRTLTFMFPVPHYAAQYQTKPWAYIGHLVGSEAAGSLLSFLKNLGWAEALVASELPISQQDSLFQITINLTQAGVKAKDQIVSILFENLKLISSRGIADWRFNELKHMAELEFRFHKKLPAIDSAAELAQAMHDYPAGDILKGAYSYANFDEKLIKQALSYLHKDNAMVAFVDPDISTTNNTTKTTQYYQTPFSYTAGIPTLLALKPTYQQKLFLPDRNIFIPKNTAVKTPLILPVPDAALQKNIPTLLIDNDQLKLWFLQDQYYRSPKAELNFRFKLPALNNSLENAARMQLFAALILDQLNEFSYPASVAGLNFSMAANPRGFDLTVAGYSDKQNLLLNKIISAISHANFNDNRFEKIKENLLREWRNDDKNLPYEVLLKKIPRLQYMPYWGAREYADALQKIPFNAFKPFAATLLNGAKIEAFFYGNLYSQDAIKLGALIEHQLLQKQSNRLPQLAKVLRSENKHNKSSLYTYPLEHKDHSVALYIQALSPTAADTAPMLLLNQILHAAFYNQLRTEQQLGYIVALIPVPLKNIESSVFVVQSPAASSEGIMAAINTFLVNATANVTDDFINHKNALLSQLREVPTSLENQAEKYWESILLSDKSFTRNQELILAVNKITPESLRAYYEAVYLQKNRRLWLATDKIGNIKDFEAILNVADYQQKQQGYLYP